jgi:stage II sporulation protein D
VQAFRTAFHLSQNRRACVALALVLGTLLVFTACSTRMRPTPMRTGAAKLPTHVRIKLPNGSVRPILLEEYVRGTIISEFAPAIDAAELSLVERMLEVQSVVARTFAVANIGRHARQGYDLCSTTHCQLYEPARLKTSTWAPAATVATDRTAGLFLWHAAAPARAVFHADCGGHTSAAADVWGGTVRPYLQAIADDGPAEAAHVSWKFETTMPALLKALNDNERTRVGKQLSQIAVKDRDHGGRARTVVLKGTRDIVVRGEDFRAVLSQAFGAKSIRSTRFTVTRQGGRFIFEGQGFGHGVGLCQVGALARLKAGSRPEQVLARYYPGARLLSMK